MTWANVMPVTPGRYGHARVAVLSVIEEETMAVRKVFDLVDRVSGKPYFVGPGHNPLRPIVVNREVGRTNIQSGDCIRDVIEHWRPEVLVLCGVAGGIAEHEEVQLGDVIIPNYIHYCSFAKLSENGQQRRYLAYDHPSLPLHANYAAPLRDDESWMNDEVRTCLPDGRLPRVFIGSLIAGDKVYGDPNSEEQRRIIADFDDAIAVDMESVGLCRAVAASRTDSQYNPRLLIVRAISDLVGHSANNAQRTRYKSISATVAAIFAYRVVSDIVENEPDSRMYLGESDDN
jgi:nucleoside phosphorylase